jgi:small-conductance mechanosensitive channel
VALLVMGGAHAGFAQPQPQPQPQPPERTQPSAAAATPASPPADTPSQERLVQRVPDEQFVELRFSNRYILTFRANIVPRDPRERADGAMRGLARMVEDNVTGPVSSRRLFGASVITVAGKDMFAIVQPDADDASNEDLTQVTADVVSRLSVALREAAEARTPERLLRAGLRSLMATLLLAAVLVALARLRRLVARRVSSVAQAGLARTGLPTEDGESRSSWVLVVVQRAARFLAIAIGAVVVYTWLTYVLQQFPVSRPWGEALGGFLLATVKRLGWGALTAMPGLFTAAIIFLCTRFVIRLAVLVFDAVEQGRLHVAGIDGPRALPTRRIVTTLLWLFAIVIAYPYLPGSNTEAFKGVSVFIGLVVSIGSSGIVNQLMSGFMLTYSDAIAPGEYVRLGDIEGTVTRLGVLSTKVRTRRNEEVTIPNAVVISGTATNYTRNAAEGVFAPVVVTIGYDAPWRQVEALLLLAASRSEGLRQVPAPRVLQTALSDFYVEYTLLVCLEQPAERIPIMSGVHARIQDAFNEHGVQIMSPHYEADPNDAKLVPPAKWYEAPAKRRSDG